MRAIVCGLGTSIENNVREYHDGDETEAELVKRIGKESGDCWFVHFDDDAPGVNRSRRIRRMIP